MQDVLSPLTPSTSLTAWVFDPLGAALVVADVVRDGHENAVVVQAVCGLLQLHKLRVFALQHENAGLDADVRLECVRVKVDAGENFRLPQNPLAHIAKTG